MSPERKHRPKSHEKDTFNEWPEHIVAALKEARNDMASRAVAEVAKAARSEEVLSPDTQEEAISALHLLDSAGQIISDFFHRRRNVAHFRDGDPEIIIPAMGEVFGHIAIPQMEEGRVQLEVVEYKKAVLEGLLQKTGESPKLPTNPAEARSQIAIRLTDIAGTDVEEILSAREAFQQNYGHFLSSDPANAVRAQENLGNFWETELAFRTQSAYYDPVLEHPVKKPSVGLRARLFPHVDAQGNIVKEIRFAVLDNILPGDFERPLPVSSIPRVLDQTGERTLTNTLNSIYHAIASRVKTIDRK